MSRSRKDGRSGGGHHEARRTGKEYWGRRPPVSMATPGRYSKTRTHRAERREGNDEAMFAEERAWVREWDAMPENCTRACCSETK